MQLEILSAEFSVLKYPSGPIIPENGIWFAARTDKEASLVCETRHIPSGHIAREDHWRAMRVVGQLEFSLIGILSGITETLRRAEISVFCVSTYDTDYILVKSDRLCAAEAALKSAGYEMA